MQVLTPAQQCAELLHKATVAKNAGRVRHECAREAWPLLHHALARADIARTRCCAHRVPGLGGGGVDGAAQAVAARVPVGRRRTRHPDPRQPHARERRGAACVADSVATRHGGRRWCGRWCRRWFCVAGTRPFTRVVSRKRWGRLPGRSFQRGHASVAGEGHSGGRVTTLRRPSDSADGGTGSNRGSWYQRCCSTVCPERCSCQLVG